MSCKKNWSPSLRSTKELIVNQNSFKVLSILYIKNFRETRKINSNAIRLLPGVQEVGTKLAALKIIFQRGWTLNNQGQKLFQLGHWIRIFKVINIISPELKRIYQGNKIENTNIFAPIILEYKMKTSFCYKFGTDAPYR